MRIILQIVSYLALTLTVVPSVLLYSGLMGFERVKLLMLIATVVWFAVTPCWMGREKGAAGSER